MDSGPGITRDEASRENQDMEERQSFPMGLIESTVGENSQSRELLPWRPFKKFRVVTFNYLMSTHSMSASTR